MIEPLWAAVLVAIGMLGAASGLGRLLIRLLPAIRPDDRLIAIGLGLGALGHGWLILGQAGWYRRDVAWFCWGAGFLSLAWDLTRTARTLAGRAAGHLEPHPGPRGAARVPRAASERLGVWGPSRPPTDQSGPSRPPMFLEAALTAALGAVLIAGAFVPPFGVDSVRHHLYTAKLFVADGGLTFHPTGFAARPMAGEMFYVWSLLLSGPVAGKVVIAFHGLLAACAIARLARRHGEREDGFLAALVFLAITEVWYLGLDGKVDAVLLLHVALALLTLDAWRVEGTRAALVLAGVFTGFAASSALVGLYAAVALAAVLAAHLATAHGPWSRRATSGAVFLIAAVLTGAPWYARAWHATGDPLWPLLYPWIGGAQGSAGMAQAIQEVLAAFAPLGHDLGGFLRGFAAMMTGAAMLFRRSLVGPLFLAGIPLLAFDPRAARRAAWLIVFAAVHYAVWFPFVQWPRLLLPAFVALSVAAGVGLGAGARRGALARAAVRCAVALWGLASLGLALSLVPTFGPVLVGRESLDAFLGRVTSYHADIRWMNAHLPADAVVAADHPGLYYLERRSIWLEGFQGFIDYARLDDVAALRSALARWNVTHLFLTTDESAPGWPEARLRHALAAACGDTMYRNPDAVDVASIVLGERERRVATVVALRPRCGESAAPRGEPSTEAGR